MRHERGDSVEVETEEEKIIRVSVRNLVEFIMRGGDIDNRTSGGMDKEAMLMGGRLHRKIQRSMGSDYHAEVALKTVVLCDGFRLQVEGRADGVIIHEEDGKSEAVIDEIKGAGESASGSGKMLCIYLCSAKWPGAYRNSDDLLSS